MRKLENYTPTRFMAADSTYNKQMADYAVNFIEITVLYDNPVKQAEYLYSIIESESK